MKKILLLLLSVMLFNCSSDSDPEPEPDPDVITGIRLKKVTYSDGVIITYDYNYNYFLNEIETIDGTAKTLSKFIYDEDYKLLELEWYTNNVHVPNKDINYTYSGDLIVEEETSSYFSDDKPTRFVYEYNSSQQIVKRTTYKDDDNDGDYDLDLEVNYTYYSNGNLEHLTFIKDDNENTTNYLYDDEENPYYYLDPRALYITGDVGVSANNVIKTTGLNANGFDNNYEYEYEFNEDNLPIYISDGTNSQVLEYEVFEIL